MNFENLFHIQGGLDYHIKKHKGLSDKDFFEEKLLAFQVEVGELANEWRGFKFWSDTPHMKSRDKTLEEYVDGLHFLLSMGIDLGIFEPDMFGWYSVKSETVTIQFLQVLDVASSVRFERENNYDLLFSLYLGLGEMLGFTEEEIEYSYLAKNEENHRRQLNGY